MVFARRGRYSGYIRPIQYAIDLATIHFLAQGFFSDNSAYYSYIIFVSLAWIVLSVKSNFYEIYRFTKVVKILSLIGLQSILFTLLVFAFFGIYNEMDQDPVEVLIYIAKVFGVIGAFKLAIYYLLKRYRLVGGNYRNVIILGLNQKTEQLRKFFTDNPEYGYQLIKTYDFSAREELEMQEVFDFVLANNIDEIYSSIAELDNDQLGSLVDFADNNLKILKFVPDNKEIYSRRLEYNYYGYLPVLSLRRIPILEPFNLFIKRSFDIMLALIIIVGLLSWLTPLLAIIIKLESKGPVFFKQKRNGLDYKEFFCYKFRSMRPNPMADLHQVTRGDQRITRVGRIIRKTSIDELPQFINVLKGEMSVVGPRPHMVSHTHMYAERIDKFMVRHFIKPGITGLAQVTGYRGEVETDEDIINRVKFDIFYLENWSMLLDLKIIVQTVYNAIRGDEKAY